MKLFIDDERFPPTDDFIIVRSYADFIYYASQVDHIDYISFDHDLGLEETGYHCALYLIQKGITLGSWDVHSMNPIGADRIRKVLQKYENPS